jgi:CSLREA domain-containing protein
MTRVAVSDSIKRMFVAPMVFALAGALFALGAGPAHASTTFTVNSTADDFDGDTADGVCEALVFGDSGRCTLRAAIEQANATAGADTINFNIPGTLGVKTISPTSQLPVITEQVTINGYTQPGASPNTKAVGDDANLLIELDGHNGGWSGLRITSSNNLVKGLVINAFSLDGVLLSNAGATNNHIEGNFIGTDATGTQDLGNGYGVDVLQSGGNTIGGPSAGARNLISGNDADGIIILSSGNTVQGNYIGTKKDGASGLGNSGDGVDIFSSNNVVGGAMLSEGNRISSNGDEGVEVGNFTGNVILANSIYANSGLGIDLFPDGVTLNDPKDPDIGGNNLQNYPVITRASTLSRGKTAIKGNLGSTPDTKVEVQFFANPKGTDEGKTLIGRRDMSTGADGRVSFTFKLTRKVPRGQAITATATDPNGNTSEFSAPRKVVRRR